METQSRFSAILSALTPANVDQWLAIGECMLRRQPAPARPARPKLTLVTNAPLEVQESSVGGGIHAAPTARVRNPVGR